MQKAQECPPSLRCAVGISFWSAIWDAVLFFWAAISAFRLIALVLVAASTSQMQMSCLMHVLLQIALRHVATQSARRSSSSWISVSDETIDFPSILPTYDNL